MTVETMADQLGLEAKTPLTQAEVTGAVATDLISDVLANGAPGQVWLTIQTHRNVAAVASTQELSAIIICGPRLIGRDLLSLAQQQGICVLATAEDTFTVAGRLYELGLR